MKSIRFVKNYYHVCSIGQVGCTLDADADWFVNQGFAVHIPYESKHGALSRHALDLQVHIRDRNKYQLAKLQFGETWKEDKKENERAEIVADYIIDEYSIVTLRDSKNEEMWWKSKGVYKNNAKSVIIEIAHDFYGKGLSSSIIKKVELLIQAKTFQDPHDFFNNTSRTKVGCANGILNLSTFSLERDGFNNPDNIFVRIPVEYDPSAKCPNFEAFLKGITASQEDYLGIQEIFGFCLLPEYKFEKFFILTGNGRNGKSKLLVVLKSLLGQNNTISHGLQILQEKDFAVAELHNKLANVGGDISNDALRGTNRIKELTGQDLITANRKFKDYISFISYAKQVFACNELPPIYDSSLGFWNRIIRIDFPYTFYERSEYEALKDKSKAKIRNEAILENILTPSELSGILNWSLEGLQRLLKNKEFSNAQNTEKTRSEWMRKSNSFYAFFQDMFVFDEQGYVPAQIVHSLYSHYCELHGLPQINNQIRRDCIQAFTGRSITSWPIDDVKCWRGIAFKPEIAQRLLAQNLLLTEVTKFTEFFEKLQSKNIKSIFLENPVNLVNLVRERVTSIEKSTSDIAEEQDIEKVMNILDKMSSNGDVVETRPGYWVRV